MTSQPNTTTVLIIHPHPRVLDRVQEYNALLRYHKDCTTTQQLHDALLDHGADPAALNEHCAVFAGKYPASRCFLNMNRDVAAALLAAAIFDLNDELPGAVVDDDDQPILTIEPA